jgi:uncharacterized SAM-binding protein YcdF (DUF218 family)
MRKLLVLAVLLVIVLYAVGAVLFSVQPDDALGGGSADAVVVLAGGESRLPVALELAREHVAPVLVVSEDPTGKDELRTSTCATGHVEGAQLVCRTASPYSTRGEARMVAELAERRGWDRIVVVTSRYHLFRAERIIARCTDTKLVMRGAPDSIGRNLIAIPFEWAKLGLAETFRRGC